MILINKHERRTIPVLQHLGRSFNEIAYNTNNNLNEKDTTKRMEPTLFHGIVNTQFCSTVHGKHGPSHGRTSRHRHVSSEQVSPEWVSPNWQPSQSTDGCVYCLEAHNQPREARQQHANISPLFSRESNGHELIRKKCIPRGNRSRQQYPTKSEASLASFSQTANAWTSSHIRKVSFGKL